MSISKQWLAEFSQGLDIHLRDLVFFPDQRFNWNDVCLGFREDIPIASASKQPEKLEFLKPMTHSYINLTPSRWCGLSFDARYWYGRPQDKCSKSTFHNALSLSHCSPYRNTFLVISIFVQKKLCKHKQINRIVIYTAQLPVLTGSTTTGEQSPWRSFIFNTNASTPKAGFAYSFETKGQGSEKTNVRRSRKGISTE